MARRKKQAKAQVKPEQSADDLETARAILKNALGNVAHTIHPLPADMDEDAATVAVNILAVAGFVHNRGAHPNLTPAGVEAARKL